MRAKHQKRASSTPPTNPLIPTASSRFAHPSKCLLHSLGEPGDRQNRHLLAYHDSQLIISRTHNITHDAITAVPLLCSSGSRRWIASWYKAKLSDEDLEFSFISICRADKANIELRRWAVFLAIIGILCSKCRLLSNLSSWALVSMVRGYCMAGWNLPRVRARWSKLSITHILAVVWFQEIWSFHLIRGRLLSLRLLIPISSGKFDLVLGILEYLHGLGSLIELWRSNGLSKSNEILEIPIPVRRSRLAGHQRSHGRPSLLDRHSWEWFGR